MKELIAAVHRVYERTTLEHWHDFRQIVFPERGRLDLVVCSERGAVAGSLLAVVEPGAEHSCWTESDASCLVIDLRAEPEIRPSAPAFRRIDARLRALRDAVATELDLGGLAEPLIADGLARYAAGALGMTPRVELTGAGRIARLAKEAIDARFRTEVSISALAADIGASVSHLQRSFKAEHGVGIVGYTVERRLTHAASLLIETDLPVTAIAMGSGFETASYFTRRFTARFGVAPARYRAAIRAASVKTSPRL